MIVQTVRAALLRILPIWVVQAPGALIRTRPMVERTCNLCGFAGLFGSNGRPPRIDALCPRCGSLERHRLLGLVLERHIPELPTPILHFAPERVLERALRGRYGDDYRTADLYQPDVDEQLDIENIARDDRTVGTIIANHVLEHVDDLQALSEIARILRDDGLLICEIPIIEGWEHTYEPDGIAGTRAAEVHFGQDDHVRFYGADFRDRVRSAGLRLEEYTAEGEDVIVYGLVRGEKVFIIRPEPAG